MQTKMNIFNSRFDTTKHRLINRKIYQFRSVVQPCLTLCNPMDCSTPGFPVHCPHQFLELAQTHVHRVRRFIKVN